MALTSTFFSVAATAMLAVTLLETTTLNRRPIINGAAAWNGVAGPYWYKPFTSEESGNYNFNFSWTMKETTTTSGRGSTTGKTTQYIESTLVHNVPANGYWVGVGFKSLRKMDGLIVMCYCTDVAAGWGGAGVNCEDVQGVDYHLHPWTGGNLTSLISTSHSSSGEAVLKFQTLVVQDGSDLGVAALGPDPYRTIFSWGPMKNKKPDEESTKKYGQHPGRAITGASIDFVTGVVDFYPTRGKYLTLVIFWALTVVIAVVIRLVDYLSFFKVHHNARITVACIIPLPYLGLLVYHTYYHWQKYYAVSSLGPFVRSLGDAASFLLMGVLLTVSRRGFFSEFFLVSHERAIKYHLAIALLLVVATVWHMIGMANMYGGSFLFSWKKATPPSWGTPVLSGLLGGFFFIVCFLFALVRFDFSYVLFRATHFAWIPAVVFTILHYPPAGIYLSVPLGFLFLGFLYGRICNTRATCHEAWFDKKARVFMVAVKRPYGFAGVWNGNGAAAREIGVDPAQWCYLRFPEVSKWQFHPFSIYRADLVRDPHSGEVTHQILRFAIKETKGTGGGGSMVAPYLNKLWTLIGFSEKVARFKKWQSWTTHLAECYEEEEFSKATIASRDSEKSSLLSSGLGERSEQQNATDYAVPLNDTSSSAVRGHSKVPLSIEGPFGSVQLPLKKYSRILLVSGGIGLTPNLLILQHLATMAHDQQQQKKKGSLKHVVWTWVNREDSLLPLFMSDIMEFSQKLTNSGVKISILNYITAKSKVGAEGDSPSSPSQRDDDQQQQQEGKVVVEPKRGCRPDYKQIIIDEFGGDDDEGEEGGNSDSRFVGVYGCGPTPMLDSSKKAAEAVTKSTKKRISVHVHNEVFNV